MLYPIFIRLLGLILLLSCADRARDVELLALRHEKPFQLRIDRVVPDATGRVVARPYYGASFAFDPNSKNNSAKVVVNPSA